MLRGLLLVLNAVLCCTCAPNTTQDFREIKKDAACSSGQPRSDDKLEDEPAPVEEPKDLSKAAAFLEEELGLPGSAGASQSDVSAERSSPAGGPKKQVMPAEEAPHACTTPPIHPDAAESSSDKALSICSSSAAGEESAEGTVGAEDAEEEQPEMDAVMELSSSDEELPEDLKRRARAALQSALAFECAGGAELCASESEHVKEGTHTWPPALQS